MLRSALGLYVYRHFRPTMTMQYLMQGDALVNNGDGSLPCTLPRYFSGFVNGGV